MIHTPIECPASKLQRIYGNFRSCVLLKGICGWHFIDTWSTSFSILSISWLTLYQNSFNSRSIAYWLSADRTHMHWLKISRLPTNCWTGCQLSVNQVVHGLLIKCQLRVDQGCQSRVLIDTWPQMPCTQDLGFLSVLQYLFPPINFNISYWRIVD